MTSSQWTFLCLSLQLFDEDNPLHKSDNKYIFTTEGHVVPIDERFREKQWDDLFPCEEGALTEREPKSPPPSNASKVSTWNRIQWYHLQWRIQSEKTRLMVFYLTLQCDRIPEERRYALPLKSIYMKQIDHMVGLYWGRGCMWGRWHGQAFRTLPEVQVQWGQKGSMVFLTVLLLRIQNIQFWFSRVALIIVSVCTNDVWLGSM